MAEHKAKEDILNCPMRIFRVVWKILETAKDLEEAKSRVREAVVKLVLGEE